MHSPDAVPAAGSPERSLSLVERAVAVFARPTQAWGGLRQRAQWWFPLLVTLVVAGAALGLTYERAVLPMMVSQWEQMVEDGRMPAEQMEGAERFMSGPVGMTIAIVQQAIGITLITLLAGLLIWFGCGFVLGAKLGFRLALEVAAWSSLVNIPATILTTALGAYRGTLSGVHLGFGILVATENPTRVQAIVAAMLDAIGPLALWYVAVAVFGASALSGARRAPVAWVLGGMYLVVALLMSALFASSAAG